MTRSHNKKILSQARTVVKDEFEVVDLPYRPAPYANANDLTIHLDNEPSTSSFILSCRPPLHPTDPNPHVPTDIVLVIDVSGSMNSCAPLPDLTPATKSEDSGLSILDLVKHSSRTILSTLTSADRLGIVTFSDGAKTIQELLPMDERSKTETLKRIEKLHDNGVTNLWSGIRTGLRLFEDAPPINNVQGLYVLTDGMPNHMCPKQGYVNKLRPMLSAMAEKRTTVPTIHTFGFGYSIWSDLMQSIAELGNGNYSFIPDAGMIGTVFVHAVANLQNTFGVQTELMVATSELVDMNCATVLGKADRGANGSHVFELGNLQFGQSRDFVLEYNRERPRGGVDFEISTTLKYKDRFGEEHVSYAKGSLGQPSKLPTSTAAYHQLRSKLCERLAAFFPVGSNNEHAALMPDTDAAGRFAEAKAKLDELTVAALSSPCASDPEFASLLQDLTAAEGESHGQISKALLCTEKEPYYNRWGRHYLPSLLHAHARQVCNSFKDPGPLRYGVNAPLFIKCRDELDKAFDELPSPKPSRQPVRHGRGNHGRVTKNVAIKMSRYHQSSNTCFGGECLVRMVDDTSMTVKGLRSGMELWTPKGSRSVSAVVRTDLSANLKERGQICRVGKLWVTPWHPILVDGLWVFPAAVAEEVKECTEPVYSVLLAPSADPDEHAIEVGGQVCVTLGHGITEREEGKEDVRAHAFLGNHEKVSRSLMSLSNVGGRLRCGGIKRDGGDGLACGFLPATVGSEACDVKLDDWLTEVPTTVVALTLA